MSILAARVWINLNTMMSPRVQAAVARYGLVVLLLAPGPDLARAQESAANPFLQAREKTFRAGAFAIEVSPTTLPVVVNGGMSERTSDRVLDPLYSRALVLDNGTEQLAIVVVDSCMMPRALLDEAKALAAQATGMRPERMLISATHTHAAPSVMELLGSRRDDAYARFLSRQIAKGIKLAHDRLAPARIGWAIGQDKENVFCRRWLMKPGTLPPNPFGRDTDRALVQPGNLNPDLVRPTGPVDPDVAVLSVQSPAGQPLALLANYSMHFVGAPPVSADYFGVFCEEISKLVGADVSPQPFVAMISNGTSGDAWCVDFSKPKRIFDRRSVGKDVAAAAFEAYQRIRHYEWMPLVMKETQVTLAVRMPTKDDLATAKATLEEFAVREEGQPMNRSDLLRKVYAGETIALHKMPPTRELKLQAIRIGELGITAMPNEVFGITGLAIKRQSPIAVTFNISLANGADGYIPPPDQFPLGGYTTWRARSSCLEVGAEPKIKDAVVKLLHDVARQ